LPAAAAPRRLSTMKKILIVEDHEDVREVIRITLEGEDYELHEAADGLQGLAMARQLKPDLVLSDVMMPGLDGVQLCQQIRADPGLRRTRVVLLSARGQGSDRQAGVAAGADAYLTKPYGPLDLLDTVQRAMA
jgi:two-component system, OmpR family, phosphate regulon response regulator PhoB